MNSILEIIREGEEDLAAGREDRGFLTERWGLLPARPPELKLPESHRPWDDLAEELPDLFRNLGVRDALERMPVLDAGPDSLPDRYVWRASALVGIFAHAYVRVRSDIPPPIPASVELPWATLCSRLHRHQIALTYDDLIAYNWRLRDPARSEHRKLENLELLIPTVGNREERIFNLTQVEMLAEAAPVISAMGRAQSAVDQRDRESLERELVILHDSLERVTRSFLKVDPNPYSDTFVDPVIWAKTVAPFAVGIREGSHAISGAAAPLFQLLDVFIGRSRYDSHIGRLSLDLRPSFSPHMRALMSSLDQTSVWSAIAADGSRSLRGLWRSCLDAYLGHEGFLAVHRRKAFAYLELAFKVGRSVTTGGFSGLFDDQTWDTAHRELEITRQERTTAEAPGCPMARLFKEPQGKLTAPGMVHAVLDLSEAGVRYHPGDRLALLPRSNRNLVERTLRALHATGQEEVRLDARWIAARREIAAEEAGALPEGAAHLALAELLEFGRLRPVSRETAKALMHASGSEALKKIVTARSEGRWELWDLIELVTSHGFEPKELWRAEPWEPFAICKLVPPETYRLYSIASAVPADVPTSPRAELLISELLYRTEESAVSRQEVRIGTSSSFLRRWIDSPADPAGIPVRVVSAPRFRLPDDPTRPIVLFAGGTGIAPFLAFIAARSAQPDPPETWLFLSTRSEAHLKLYQAELSRYVSDGWLRLITVLTKGPASRDREGGIRTELESRAQAILQLARDRSDGGLGATFYACGAAGFAAAASDALESALAIALDDGTAARSVMRRLIGVGRYQQDVFSSHRAEAEAPALIDASTVALHNDDAHGYWMIIDGSVYDVTELAHRHPGGRAIVIEHAGRDATQSYRTIEHHLDPEIEAMLGMYEIGKIRRLDFGSGWSIAVGSEGLTFFSLADAFRAWVRMLHLTVEVENAVRHDFGILDTVTVVGDEPAVMTHLKARLLLEAHQRFLTVYLPSLFGKPLDQLWSVTASLAGRDLDVRLLRRHLDAIAGGVSARAAEIKIADAWTSLDTGDLARMVELRRTFEAADLRFLAAAKQAIRSGVIAFERHERRVVEESGSELLEMVNALPPLLAELYSRI